MPSLTNYGAENRREKWKRKISVGMLNDINEGNSYQLIKGTPGSNEVEVCLVNTCLIDRIWLSKVWFRFTPGLNLSVVFICKVIPL